MPKSEGEKAFEEQNWNEQKFSVFNLVLFLFFCITASKAEKKTIEIYVHKYSQFPRKYEIWQKIWLKQYDTKPSLIKISSNKELSKSWNCKNIENYLI